MPISHMIGAPLWKGLLLALAVVGGIRIAGRAWRKLRFGQLSIELLVTIAVGGALALGEFWEAAAVAGLFLLGARVEAGAMRRTRQALKTLIGLVPETATVLRDGIPVSIPPEQVQPGDMLLIAAGARIPVDGEVAEGRAAVDESAITGESLPAEKVPGARVYAGTISRDGALRVRATAVGSETALARIVERVEDAQDQKAPVQRLIDRFARWYTPAIIAAAGLTFLVTGRAELALTLLVIGCPGALVIATPVAVMAGIGRAAQRGILMKGGWHLEAAGTISALALDKTGTLTEGRPRLTDVISLDPSLQPSDVLRWAAIAESGSGHPIALPIVAEAGKLYDLPSADALRVHAGLGVASYYEGHEILVGGAMFLRQSGVEITPAARAHLDRLTASGTTAVFAALDARLIGVLAVGDTQRESATQMAERMSAAGVSRIAILTGDDPRAARAVAASAGIDEVYAGLLPDDKLALIRRMQSEGDVVAMAGDGINDAPALAAADIGISMGHGAADLAIETSDIVLMTGDLLKLPEMIRISRATRRTIRQNVALAMLTVIGLLAGVLTGSVHMAGGMLIHELSVVAVTLNAARLLRV